MNFVILFLFSTIVFTLNSESSKDNSHPITNNGGNLEGENSNTITSNNKKERVSDRSVSNSNGKKYRDEDKSVDTHAKDIEDIIEKMPKEDQAVAYKIHAKWSLIAKGRESKLKAIVKDIETNLTAIAKQIKKKLDECTLYAKKNVIALDLRYAIEQSPNKFILTMDQAMERQGKIIAEIKLSIKAMQSAFITIIKNLISVSVDDETDFKSKWSELKKFPIVQVQIDQKSDPLVKAIVNLKNADKLENAKKIWKENEWVWEARIVVNEKKKNEKKNNVDQKKESKKNNQPSKEDPKKEKENNVDQKKESTKKVNLSKEDIVLIEELTTMNKSKEIQHYVKIDVLSKENLDLKHIEKLYVDYVISVGRVFSQDVTKVYKQCSTALAMTSESEGKALIDQLKQKENWKNLDTWHIIDQFCMGESYLWNLVSDADLHGFLSRLAPQFCRPEEEDIKSYIAFLYGEDDFVYDVAEYLIKLFPRAIKRDIKRE